MTRRPGRELPDHGLPDEDLPDRAVLERIWSVLSRWAVPVMMTLAYVLLVATSDTDTFGTLLMAAGLVLVFIGWFVFRALTEAAGLSRALSVGDVPRLRALADRHLPRTRKPAARARLLVARALAHQLRGEHAAALDTLDTPGARGPLSHAQPPPDLQLLAEVVRHAALIELGRSAELRAVADPPPTSVPGTPDIARAPASGRSSAATAIASLADGLRAFARGDLDAAAARFALVIDDIRVGSAARAIAHLYTARIAETRGDASAGARHRASAAALGSPGASWLRAAPG